MAQTPITGIPGVVTDQNKYPQWGLDANTGKVAEAKNAAQKNTLIGQGYLVWFVSSAAANSFYKAQQGFLGGHLPSPLSGLAAIGDFFHRLTEGNTWLRIGEGLLGIILIALGIARMTHAVPAATKIAKAVAA